MAQLVRCLPNKHETLSLGFSNPRIKLAVAAWAYNPSTGWEAETGGSHKLGWPTWWSDMPMRDPASNNGWGVRGPLELFLDLYMCAMYTHSYRHMHRYTQIHCVTPTDIQGHMAQIHCVTSLGITLYHTQTNMQIDIQGHRWHKYLVSHL